MKRIVRWLNRCHKGEYPALQNIESGAIYLDISFGEIELSGLSREEYERHGIPGHWHLATNHPDYDPEPIGIIRKGIIFELEGNTPL